MTTDRSAPRRRRPHPALASRVLVTGLAAGTSVGLVGLLARADQVAAEAPAATTSTTAAAPAPAPPLDGPGHRRDLDLGAAHLGPRAGRHGVGGRRCPGHRPTRHRPTSDRPARHGT
ncbi:MAG TPA: hypothetical protein P5254_09550, partial [Aquihabitans sp.]|nr:hypothetical protein [Aquihabitans sp.]